LVGDATAVTDVVLTTAAVLQFAEPGAKSLPSVSVDGEGDFVGFALSQGDPSADGFAIVAGRYGDAFTPYASENHAWFGFGTQSELRPYRVELSPGRYKLYLLTDGAPASVTVKLFDRDGVALPGAGDVYPTRPAAADALRHLPVSYPIGAAGPRSAGSTVDLKGPSVGFVAMTVDHIHGNAYHRAACLHYGEPARTEIAYLPGCPRTDDGASWSEPRGTVGLWCCYGYGHFDEWLLPPMVAGRYGIGGYMASIGVQTRAQLLTFWLTTEVDR
jgi:hypothetical protein